MKRYWLFAGENYYPCGGMRDFKGAFDSPEEARAHPTGGADWAHVFDSVDAKVVSTYSGRRDWHPPADGRLEFGAAY